MNKEIKPLKYSGKWDFDPAQESVDHISLKNQYETYFFL